ncbi:hypothetical protein [Ancylobacter lacus]|uniref:hypothetical protein n=1 Tax=Ancylobacter lacus TaxID=2579970 RepID=UPI001BCBDFEC|nr:hypothetical protein [Ancylobacter lacus]MBS7541109.1 hypothetical protein [Ancylobacter lacus]
MMTVRFFGGGRNRESACARPERRRRLPTTIGFAAVPDHVRLPARFFGRFTACAVAGLR